MFLRYLVLLSAATSLMYASPAVLSKTRTSDIALKSNARRRPTPKRFVHIASRPPTSLAIGGDGGGGRTLSCDVIGSPPPSVIWLKNNMPIPEYLQHLEDVEVDPTAVARVSSSLFLAPSETTDIYTCLAISGYKTDRASTVVHTIEYNPSLSERYQLLSGAARVSSHTAMLVVTQGRAAALRCAARGGGAGGGAGGGGGGGGGGRRAARVAWRRGAGGRLPAGRTQILKSGTLVIHNVTWSDMGEYVCSVRGGGDGAGGEVTAFLYPAAAARGPREDKLNVQLWK